MKQAQQKPRYRAAHTSTPSTAKRSGAVAKLRTAAARKTRTARSIVVAPCWHATQMAGAHSVATLTGGRPLPDCSAAPHGVWHWIDPTGPTRPLTVDGSGDWSLDNMIPGTPCDHGAPLTVAEEYQPIPGESNRPPEHAARVRIDIEND